MHAKPWNFQTRFADWAHDVLVTDSEPTGRRRKDAESYAAKVVLSLGTAVAR